MVGGEKKDWAGRAGKDGEMAVGKWSRGSRDREIQGRNFSNQARGRHRPPRLSAARPSRIWQPSSDIPARHSPPRPRRSAQSRARLESWPEMIVRRCQHYSADYAMDSRSPGVSTRTCLGLFFRPRYLLRNTLCGPASEHYSVVSRSRSMRFHFPNKRLFDPSDQPCSYRDSVRDLLEHRHDCPLPVVRLLEDQRPRPVEHLRSTREHMSDQPISMARNGAADAPRRPPRPVFVAGSA